MERIIVVMKGSNIVLPDKVRYSIPDGGIPTNEHLAIDLHLYTFDGRHVGMNYSAQTFEKQIPGVTYVGGTILDQVDYPTNLDAYYVLDPTPARRWVEDYNRFAEAKNARNRGLGINLTLPPLNLTEVNATVSVGLTRFDSTGRRIESSPTIIYMNLERPFALYPSNFTFP